MCKKTKQNTACSGVNKNVSDILCKSSHLRIQLVLHVLKLLPRIFQIFNIPHWSLYWSRPLRQSLWKSFQTRCKGNKLYFKFLLFYLSVVMVELYSKVDNFHSAMQFISETRQQSATAYVPL